MQVDYTVGEVGCRVASQHKRIHDVATHAITECSEVRGKYHAAHTAVCGQIFYSMVCFVQ
jgi:hypothetical protein